MTWKNATKMGIKISELPIAKFLVDGNEVFPIVQTGTTKQVSFKDAFTKPEWLLPLKFTMADGTTAGIYNQPIFGASDFGFFNLEKGMAIGFSDLSVAQINRDPITYNFSSLNIEVDNIRFQSEISDFFFTELRITPENVRFHFDSNPDIFRMERDISGERLGFFGNTAAKQSITNSSADAAIIELQNVLIAYGLATDNR